MTEMICFLFEPVLIPTYLAEHRIILGHFEVFNCHAKGIICRKGFKSSGVFVDKIDKLWLCADGGLHEKN